MIESLVCFHNSDDVDDPVGQLEQQVMGSNGLITQQQAEISQLQGICINLQKVTHYVQVNVFRCTCVDLSLKYWVIILNGLPLGTCKLSILQ